MFGFRQKHLSSSRTEALRPVLGCFFFGLGFGLRILSHSFGFGLILKAIDSISFVKNTKT